MPVVVPVSEVRAIDMVSNLPEVKTFVATLTAKHASPHVTANDQLQYDSNNQPYWDVQVYESLSDHNSTFGWYDVYQNTGKIEQPAK